MQIESDPYCANVVAAVKAEFERNRAREFLRVVEARKVEAEPVEIQILAPLEDYLKAVIDPENIPTNMHEPDWFERRARDGEYD